MLAPLQPCVSSEPSTLRALVNVAFGNATGQGFVNPSEIIAEKVIIVGDNGALYVYYPSQSSGDLRDSITYNDAEDAEGNALVPDIASYSPAAGRAAALSSAAVQFYTGPDGGGGPWTVRAYIDFSPQSANGTGALILGNGSGNDNGFMCVYFPSEDNTGASDYYNILQLLTQFGNVLLTPGQYYINALLDLSPLPEVELSGSGSGVTDIQQVTPNTGGVLTAGQGQHIKNITFSCPTQQPSTNTDSVGITFGHPVHGSAFLCEYDDLQFYQFAQPMQINPALNGTPFAGLFSCYFGTIHCLGQSIGSTLESNGGGGAANCTGCVIDNLYIHNNATGSDANTTSFPILFKNWDDLTIRQLNVEHSEVFDSDIVGFSNTQATVDSLHIEHTELSGNPHGFGAVYCNNSNVTIRVMSLRFQSWTAPDINSVVRFDSGATYGYVHIEGLKFPTDTGGFTAPIIALVNFDDATGCTCIIDAILVDTPITQAFANWATGDSLTIIPAQWNYVGAAGQPAFAADWGNFGGGNADLAFVMTAPNELWINGVVTPSAGAGTTLFTLPAAFRPANINIISGTDVTTSAACTWAVSTAGAVVFRGTLTTNDEYVINGRIALTQ